MLVPRMSLSAKIEAVIYASEEPVTLPQLVSLLGVEAQAELNAHDALQGSLLPLKAAASPDGGVDEGSDADGLDPEALNAETLGSSEWEADANTAAEPAASPLDRSTAAVELSASEPSPVEAETQPVAAPTTEAIEQAQAKREARERERRLREYFRSLLDRLTAEYAQGDRGLEIREVAGGFRFGTKPEFHDTVRGFVRSLKPPLKLSLQALETLAVVAYKQPVTAPEIGEIRGVDSGGVLGSLIARKLITTAGRKQVIGRPILYKTTKEFLLRFGLKDINELPSIGEFERMAGELNEAVQEEMAMEQAVMSRSSDEAVEGSTSQHTADSSQRSPAIDEQNAAPQSESVPHQSVEDTLADKGSSPAVAGSDITESSGIAAANELEPMRDIHETQADGVPDGPP